jgi:hypothetical protein
MWAGDKPMHIRNWLLILAALLVMAWALLTSISILPAAPIAPTPTWPLGVDLPNTLHRITQP